MYMKMGRQVDRNKEMSHVQLLSLDYKIPGLEEVHMTYRNQSLQVDGTKRNDILWEKSM